MTREPIEVTRQDRIYCLKVSSDYHPEVCEECKFYPNCDHMTQDDMTELTIKDLEVLEQEPILDKIRAEIQDIAFDSQEIDGEHESIMILELNDALNIIDKYKAKSEVEDGKCK